MTMGAWVLVVMACAACSKKAEDAPPPAAGSAAKTIEVTQAPTKPRADPWNASPPPGASTALGTSSGDDLAKIAVKPTDEAKLEVVTDKSARAATVKAIAAPVDDGKLAIKSFANVDTSHGFRVTYNPSTNPSHEQYRTIFVENRVFENVAEGLNKTVRLPASVDVQTVDCDTVNAFYDPNSKRIIVCYELLDYFMDVFKGSVKDETELGNAVLGATMFSFFHEAGHGLIHLLELPAVGREEDSVDQLATLTLIAAGDEGVAMALAGAYWFQLQAKTDRKTPFWDEHAFDGQRFYNIMCLIYGSNPEKYAGFVASGTLPKDRAQRCPEEYAKINKAWEKLLQPHFTNGAAINVAYAPIVPAKEAPKTTNSDPWGSPSTGGGTTAPAADPWGGAAKPAPAAKAAQITCEQIAFHAVTLIRSETIAQAGTLSADQNAALDAELDTALPAAGEQILAECAKANWSETARRCVLDAPTLDAATKCGT
ncbi:MAG: DUF4344 domain-containing metallopeptidase [Kofleriaceae bacterium]|nr:DUF4344 domain-containing metallopeptidase [Kofleriaceae bacterium]